MLSGAACTAMFDATYSSKADQVIDNSYIQVFIKKVRNGLQDDCSLNSIPLPSGKVVKISQGLRIPFISIGNYLRECTERVAYVPEKALKIQTPYGGFRVWADQRGVLYAPDPRGGRSQEDWKAKKLIGITADEHGGKELFLASLVLKVIKGKSNKEKFKISLESAQ